MVYITSTPDGTAAAVQVYCDMVTENGAWTVFQRRLNGCTNFYRDWNSYKHGFGNPSEEYWLGNEIIHEISSHGNHELRIEMTDFDGNSKYAEYRVFGLGDEIGGYPLLISSYTGTAGDSLYHTIHNHIGNGVKFSTFDRDNDINTNSNCAQQFSGAWWYIDCHLSNLNGKYLGGYYTSFADGIVWNSFKGMSYSLKTVNMMFQKYQ
ncbi:Fibrinogen-like protein A,Ryncolin-4,Angiopoietin-related protein 7,Angiopoietin-related protein 1,Ficolin-3,Ficolin-1-B,Techylectin-5A,Ficolin-2,Ryncolin-1,Tenascin-R,Fibrinogen-like protein 1,Angiopoietin-1,Fibrinogen C domain-containing protein 1-A,Tenascin-N,Ryncolin-3,Tenascin,Fibroleukin,Fibrinogen C domain-containing protein 1,Techylectin-like protein,Ryncolin-2,Angiopoietin-related protein 6,Techylectin-5B,Angiopoietin-related protein 2,Angiopoietin-2,Microfibril-associated glycoprotein 4,Fibrinoge|uniref:Fibrinogen C-terminal domain-containing protein n=1 Tax=Mytilus coruscus TaxID=42192 RepID=A0A6J8D6G7_MYTCO|nr:Fibrinogen-like protein A,Ryncolin-4,Angiopoietin-related protein 7,Angiopoietin-related protein 1,Ficolin-3,Ficolin-1-B,Techylectin-5A,Ficolin-2,Ryncolin-1,Tenascin-R,Fibrinogen-like protein 1,Angiopoietin-1,Fibrinogen C domain-containing protein 1-A,Tenascin-N,Ryncolin-3,Tenascin,Fibroleukin,Fibrinogen C domain-containing protein 1,Techylectin-like protein,Ryncolin-2,Angiopoietin-related protein 6,Techylectin-5B,Angiopoietin-related protein 2,Angiopoietin-2,Microfibril-associated glycoprotein 